MLSNYASIDIEQFGNSHLCQPDISILDTDFNAFFLGIACEY